MDCPDCTRRLQDRLRGVTGVLEAEGNPVSGRLRIAYDGARVDPAELRAEIGRLGYVAHAGTSVSEGARARGAAVEGPGQVWRGRRARRTAAAIFLSLLGGLLRLTGPAPLLLPLPGHALHLPDLFFVAAAAVAGWNFFPLGYRAARTLSLDMNFLMTIAIVGALGIGQYPEAAAIAFLFSVAELLEVYAVRRAHGSIASLLALSPDTARVVRKGEPVMIAAAEVRVGELVLVRPGEKIPIDGTVEEGRSWVNQAPITGESAPVSKEAGDPVYAGTVNGEGHLRLRASREAGDTTLATIVRLVEEAERHKAPSERFIEKFARRYTPAVTVAAIAVALIPPLLLDASFGVWFVRGLTLLVIACPCALVISTPVAVVSGITAAARNGVLIKGGDHLESLGAVQVFAYDKTGTLTRGHLVVTDVLPLDGASESEVLALAAALERHSAHPIAGAIRRASEGHSNGESPNEAAGPAGAPIDARALSDFRSITGQGVRARLDGQGFVIGKPEIFGSPSGASDGENGWWTEVRRLRERGKSVIAIGPECGPLGLIAVRDTPRDGAARAIRELRRAGISLQVMLTGDSRGTAEVIGADLGVDEVHSELLPAEKAQLVRHLEERYGSVAMIGDGVNDAPALATASVGIAMGAAGSDAAIETADVALMGNDLSRLAYLCRLSRRSRGVIRGNIAAAVLLKGMLAVGVPLGLVSLPLAVIVGDLGASLAVTLNSLRLGRLRPRPRARGMDGSAA